MTTNFELSAVAGSRVWASLTSTPSAGAYVGCFSETPFTISLSAEDNNSHTVHLYAAGSNSAPYQIPQNKWSHLIPQWRFTDTAGTQIDSVTLSGTLTSTDFFYVDDRASTIGSPVTVWAVVDYSDYPVLLDSIPNGIKVPGYANSMVLANVEHNVYGLTPTRLKITRNGRDPFFDFYWINTEIPAYVTLHGALSVVTTLSASKDPILFDIPSTNTIGQSMSTIIRTVTGQGEDVQVWNPLVTAAYMSAIDVDGFTIGGYLTNTVKLTAESLSTLITASMSAILGSETYQLTGLSNFFNILEFDTYDIRRFNESWDATRVMQSYGKAPHIHDNATLWEGYISGVFGGKETEQGKAFGRESYERIQNFVANHADIETCGVNQIYSLADSTDVPIDDFGFVYPPELRRIMDIVSINQQRLWGARCKCRENIENPYLTNISAGNVFEIQSFCEKCGFNHPGNRGDIFDATTYQVTANVEFIVRDKYQNNNYTLILPPPSCTTEILSGDLDPCIGLQTTTTCVTTYDLSASYWWLLPGVFTTAPSYDDFITAAVGRFCFYDYVESSCNAQIAGVINWDDRYTTLDETLSTADNWYGEDETVDKIINYVLHKGLGLIDDE